MTKASRGRPLLFNTAEELKERIEAYFNDCLSHPEEVTEYKYHTKEETYTVTNRKGEEETKTRELDDYEREPYAVKRWRISMPKTPTVTGLALFLDTSRQTLINYEENKDHPEFFDTIKKAKDLIENHWEQMLQGNNVTGVIFNLKNNYQWADRTEQEIYNPDGSLSPYAGVKDEELRAIIEAAKNSRKT